MAQISVIVPVYKSEKFLNRCVDSILAQTFRDFELILMDGELQEIRTRSEAGYPILNEKDTHTAEDFIRAYYKNIIDKWMNFFVLKKKVRCTQITKKVK